MVTPSLACIMCLLTRYCTPGSILGIWDIWLQKAKLTNSYNLLGYKIRLTDIILLTELLCKDLRSERKSDIWIHRKVILGSWNSHCKAQRKVSIFLGLYPNSWDPWIDDFTVLEGHWDRIRLKMLHWGGHSVSTRSVQSHHRHPYAKDYGWSRKKDSFP